MLGSIKCLSVAAGVAAIAVVALTGSALADGRGWKHKHKHHFVPPGHVYVVERPLYVERPVLYAPVRPMYRDSGYGGGYGGGYYGPPPPPSININIPLR